MMHHVAVINDASWRLALILAARHLPGAQRVTNCSGPGDPPPSDETWCCWTTFNRLRFGAGYWEAPLPLETELGEEWTTDGGTWGQPFSYADLAHLVIPRSFSREGGVGESFRMWEVQQDIDGLAKLYSENEIPHELSIYALEIKLY